MGKHPHKPHPPLLYIGGVKRNSYFHSLGNYRGCVWISRAKTLREFGPWRYGLRSSTGVDFKILVGQHFCQLVYNQSPPWSLLCISVYPTNSSWKAAGHAPSWCNAYQNYQLCALLRVRIDGTIQGVQSIWNSNLSTENWVFLLVDSKHAYNDINGIIILCTVINLWLSGAHFEGYCHCSSIIL